MNEELTSEHPEFWQSCYQNQQTLWDLGQVAPPFTEFLERNALTPGKMAVFGAGYGHDAYFFAEQGFDVTGFDYVPEAVEGAEARYGNKAKFVQADIFNLDKRYYGTFDYVLEHTCFCAITPSQRADYVEAVKQLLKPGGTLIGLLYIDAGSNGPPYPSTEQEIRNLFQSDFEIETLEKVTTSVPMWKDQEAIALFKLKTQ